MNISELNLVLQEGEGLTIEFKESFSSKIDRDIVAFANSRGGYILLGIKDDTHEIVGEKLTNELKAKINDLARNCDPAINVSDIQQINNVVAIRIDESREKPHGCSAGYYRRLDGGTQKMNQKELKLILKQYDQRIPYEEEVCKSVSFDNISEEKIKKFLYDAGIKIDVFNSPDILHSLNLMKGDEINNAGVLFFATHPKKYIFHCETILAAFKGMDGVNIYDRINVQDNLLAQFDQAILFLTKHLNVRSEIVGIKRHDLCEIPMEALREAVANAIIHRDYSMRGTSIIVEVHEDRVSISNPGGIPDGMDIDDIKQRSIRRNELIADLFARVNQAERMASGIKRIMKFVAEAGLPAPIIKTDSFFEITFMRDAKFKVNPISASAHTNSTDFVGNLSTRQQEILEILGNKKLPPDEIISHLTKVVSPRTLRRDLQTLKEMGLVDFEGAEGWARRWFVKK